MMILTSGKDGALMSELILKLLGGFEARAVGKAALSFPTKKTKALLAYLAAHPGKSHSRSDLANLLWGDSGDEQARASLRQTLSYLRKALTPTGREHLVVQDDLVSIDPATIQVDVATLENLTVQGIPEALERAGDLYRGDFLEGFDLREEDFNDWLGVERARLRELATEALKELLTHHMASDQLARALRVANRLLAMDPLQEQVHRTLMRLHLRQGERALALKQYESCRQVLLRELGIEPDDETKRAWKEACAATPSYGNEEGEGQSELPSEGSNGVLELPAVTASHRPKGRKWARSPLILATMSTVIVVAMVVVVAWLRPWAPEVEPTSTERIASPLPDKPSIAVLPFLNLSDDPEREYFSDGITVEIITALTRFRELFVIAWNTTFQYKKTAVDVIAVGQKLGVNYVLEGSVRQSGDRVRITVQLIDTATGGHVWAETYDRELKDIFEVQDDITEQIVGTLGGQYGKLAEARLAKKKRPTTSPKAYDYVLRSLKWWYSLSPQNHLEARGYLEKAIALDPDYAQAHAHLSNAYLNEYVFKFNVLPDSVERAGRQAKKAVELDPSDSFSRYILARYYFFSRQLDKFMVEAEKAIELNPNEPTAIAELGFHMTYSGLDRDRGLALVRKAMAINPAYPGWFHFPFAYENYRRKNYEAALEQALKINTPRFYRMYYVLAMTYGQLGREEKARQALAKMLELKPALAVETAARDEMRMWNFPEDMIDHFMEGLYKAGFPG